MSNTKASPMEYEVRRIPNTSRTLAAASVQAVDLTKDELMARAKDAGVEVTSKMTKAEITEAIRASAQGT
jgi:post-segregation antitoxin (ccd killing protein)